MSKMLQVTALLAAGAFLSACMDLGSSSLGSGFRSTYDKATDADIAATHDAGAPLTRNYGPQNWRLTDPHPASGY